MQSPVHVRKRDSAYEFLRSKIKMFFCIAITIDIDIDIDVDISRLNMLYHKPTYHWEHPRRMFVLSSISLVQISLSAVSLSVSLVLCVRLP